MTVYRIGATMVVRRNGVEYLKIVSATTNSTGTAGIVMLKS